MNAHPSTLRAVALLLAFGSALACSAILKPKDQVTRCGTADDCEPTGDNRYVPACQYGEGQELDATEVDRICVATYKPVNCAIEDWMTQLDHPITIAAGDSSCADVGCTMENAGRLGCGTMSGNCLEGTPQQFGDVTFCGGEDPVTGDPIVPGFGLSDDLELKHISDMFCKSYFCDDSFVCNRSGQCAPCEGDDFADGGCGIVYANGAPAPIYVLGEPLADDCAGPDARVDEALFGAGCGEE